ncbi:TNFAIP3-interacting protein 2-like isoform X2 [Salvelinus namaycush]|uniref:TNFAIP3-interacting protein 2 n=1 Tax=Salvelinus namaycush TaxID=8040 RepID=A0A8U0Q6U3_SALNM|nr:TNFAIP3-interacting protein 2-like isoform X2 [Salvelinus namaycush]
MDVNLDNDTLKAKIRSCNTLNTFYHETLLEIDTLNKNIYKRDNLIADLKARLGKYENTWINVEGYDHVVIAPSKSLLESLCKEICKLKQKWKDTEMNTAQQAELSQEEIQRLRQQLREKERELESVTRQPDHEKDQVIQRLRSALAERDRAQATRAVLCTSLAEEADQLRGQLGATVRVCQELLGRLEGEKKGGERVTEEVKIQQKAKEVEGLNSKWQKYDSSREEFVRSLCQRLNKSSALAAASSPAPGVGPRLGPRPTQEPGAGLGLLPELASANAGLLQQEIARLNGLLEEKMRDCGRLGRELVENRRRYQESIQTLEQQVIIYTDDFKSERADRERAQGRIQDLQEEVSQLQEQLHTQAQSPTRDVDSTFRVHMGHRISPRMSTDSAEPLLRNSVDPPVAKHQSGTSPGVASAVLAPSPTWTKCQGSSELQCPRCFTTYDDAHAREYLNHFEECARL